MDKDFSELIAFLNKKHAGMIRLEDLPSTVRIRRLGEILAFHKEGLSQKAIIIQKASKIRILHFR